MDSAVAVVGIGAMGSRLAANLLADGRRVVVSARRATAAVDALAAAGAAVAASPRAAAESAGAVLVTVRDDDASRAVWGDPHDGLVAGLRPGAVAVECSTVSPARARELDTYGVRVLEAPMVGSRPQAEARALVHLVGGGREELADVEDVLAASAATVRHVGPVGTAATLKLVVNASLATQVATLAELLGVAERAGVPAAATLEVLAGLPVTSAAAARAGAAMAQGVFAPNFPVELVAKDLGYLTALAGDTPVSRAALAAYERVALRGHGEQDLTAVAHLYLTRPPSGKDSA